MSVNRTIYYTLQRAVEGKMFRDLEKISRNLDILHVNLIICSANFHFLSIVMPDNFTDLLTETGLLLKSISIVEIIR